MILPEGGGFSAGLFKAELISKLFCGVPPVPLGCCCCTFIAHVWEDSLPKLVPAKTFSISTQ